MTHAAPAPTRPTDDAVRRWLERSLSGRFGRSRIVGRVTRRPSMYRSSFALEELEVEFADRTTLDVVFKDLSPGALSSAGRSAKPTFLIDPRREIEVYRKILGPHGIGAPACYGAVIEPAEDRYWLLLERAPGVELYQIGELEAWKRVARWLSVVHTTLATHVTRLSEEVPLLRYDAAYFGTWADRAMAALSSDVDPDPAVERLSGWLRERGGRLSARLMGLPLTVIHGELYASSVMVEVDAPDGARPAGGGIRAVDWEMAAVGPGLVDLAALTGGRWDEGRRAEMARAYWDDAVTSGAPGCPRSFEEFMASLDVCRLHLAVQWLGWSSAWVPPRQQRHDWLAEALSLIERVDL